MFKQKIKYLKLNIKKLYYKFSSNSYEKSIHINNQRIKNDLCSYIGNNYINFHEKHFEEQPQCKTYNIYKYINKM